MSLIKVLLVSLVSFLCTIQPAMAQSEDNRAINQLYRQFSQAFNQLDAGIVENIYAEDACYVPENQSKGITMGRENIIALYKKFFVKIKHKQARIEVDFRVIERQMENNNATDIGYYLIRFHPAEDAEEPISEFAGKFVNVSRKNANGKWYLTVDTNNRSDTPFYYNAKPTPELYYGRHFSPLTSELHD
ncbi:YybH family protein [Shewanella violacea]|nr:SgcJ/EcaC family oxidoreductase [Shewanella violacea]